MRVFDIFSYETNESIPEQSNVRSDISDTKNENPVTEADNPIDRVTLDIPLLLRIMEYSKEDAKTDMDLHHVVEKMIELSSSGQNLSMDHYNEIISSLTEMGGSEAENLVKAVSYDNDKDHSNYSIAKFVTKLPNGLPLVRFKILKNNGLPATDTVFDNKASAIKYMRTFFSQDIHEGHGRYWCSTDKRWKERQGPKQSRG